MQAQLKLKYNKTKFFFIALSVFFSLFPFLDKLLQKTQLATVFLDLL